MQIKLNVCQSNLLISFDHKVRKHMALCNIYIAIELEHRIKINSFAWRLARWTSNQFFNNFLATKPKPKPKPKHQAFIYRLRFSFVLLLFICHIRSLSAPRRIAFARIDEANARHTEINQKMTPMWHLSMMVEQTTHSYFYSAVSEDGMMCGTDNSLVWPCACISALHTSRGYIQTKNTRTKCLW